MISENSATTQAIYSSILERFHTLRIQKQEIVAIPSDKANHNRTSLIFFLCPSKPLRLINDPDDLERVVPQITVDAQNSKGLNEGFPCRNNKLRVLQDSLILLSFTPSNSVSRYEGYFYELNCSGAYAFGMYLGGSIFGNVIYSKAEQFILSGQKFYEELCFSGGLEFRCSLNNVLRSEFKLEYKYPPLPLMKRYKSLDECFEGSFSFTSDELKSPQFREDLISKTMQEMGRIFDANLVVENGRLIDMNSRRNIVNQ